MVFSGPGKRFGPRRTAPSGSSCCRTTAQPPPGSACWRSSTASARRAKASQFRMVALDVPPQADLPKIRELLEHGETKEWWHWEEGSVTAAWEAAARS
ncbi:DUF4265 domain-containing protein [Streptomyces sp. NPDC058695]|uniref:DUF4265 domain-containing protein n=1 Tax=Streptomyces sp. NPDC058695 TaxID=3346604 RepID=UPI00365995BA